jgi:poly-gamma-glutamate system protein
MKNDNGIIILALLSLAFFSLYQFIPSAAGTAKDKDAVGAAETMGRAIQALRGCLEGKNIAIDRRADVNLTGLIGLESSPITTSLGNLEAKRTTTNPNFAGLIAVLLKQEGVKRGDAVAVGASSSFPALIVASLAAIHAVEAKPLLICSLGASNWGANNPEFTWLEMLDCFRGNHVFDVRPVALAMGGEMDNGADMSGEGRALLSQKIRNAGIFFLQEQDLSANVQERMELYEEHATPAKISAFINIGGNWANMGTDSSVLKLKPGIAQVTEMPSPEKRGVIHEMALRKIPVIHLLYIKGLAEQYGVPWDPVPLPRPGEGSLFLPTHKSNPARLLAIGANVVAVFGTLIFILHRRKLHSLTSN